MGWTGLGRDGEITSNRPNPDGDRYTRGTSTDVEQTRENEERTETRKIGVGWNGWGSEGYRG